MMMHEQEKETMYEALKSKFNVDEASFRKDIPIYLVDYLLSNGEGLRSCALNKDGDGVKELLRDFTDKLPKDGQFRELFYTLFFLENGKTRITCVEGDYGVIDIDKTGHAISGFSSETNLGDVKGILIIHTHPSDSQVGFSGGDTEKDIAVLAGRDNANSFSVMLDQYPNADYAAVGLCTAGKRGKVLLVESEKVWGRHIFSADKLKNAGSDYR
jgi:hypothetical protein